MRHAIRIITRAAVTAAAFSGLGCQDGHYGSKDDPQGAAVKVPSIEKEYEMVGVGKPPLSFWISSGGWIKVVDETDNTMIHTAQIPPTAGGLVIKLDPDLKAITYSAPDKAAADRSAASADQTNKSVIIQPLDPSHRFELYYLR